MNKITANTLDVFPVEIQNAFKNKGSHKDGWYQVSDKGFAFNVIGNYAHGFPVLCMMFDDVMGLEDTKDLIEGKTKLDSIKLIRSCVFTFIKIHKGAIDNSISSSSRIISCKIPIAQIIRTRNM